MRVPVTVTKEQVLEAILERLKQPTKAWILASIYNGLAECSVIEVNDDGELECDEDDAAALSLVD
jgi:hypothetical protein